MLYDVYDAYTYIHAQSYNIHIYMCIWVSIRTCNIYLSMSMYLYMEFAACSGRMLDTLITRDFCHSRFPLVSINFDGQSLYIVYIDLYVHASLLILFN